MTISSFISHTVSSPSSESKQIPTQHDHILLEPVQRVELVQTRAGGILGLYSITLTYWSKPIPQMIPDGSLSTLKCDANDVLLMYD